jgi:hypothetical protein
MYISSFRATNLKCFDDAELVFPSGGGTHAGWNVLLGVNGTGKSTLLQALGLTLLGPVGGARLLTSPATWVRRRATHAVLDSEISPGPGDSTSTGAPRKTPYKARLYVTGEHRIDIDGTEYTQPQIVVRRAVASSLAAGPYSNRKGWFSAGYGPFRRLTGSGGEDETSILYGGGREARMLTLFKESAALTRCEKWLTTLYGESIDPALPQHPESAERLDDVTRLVNALLPNGVRIDTITTRGVVFRSTSGVEVALSQLSDGYRSFLALAIDLLRHLLDRDDLIMSLDEGVVLADGVVLIDEADAHLHPSWQKEIGFQMCRVFPDIQFIVSTHSPFVAQAAREDGLFVVRTDSGGRVGISRGESVRGWKADQILLSPLFGLTSTRDADTEDLMERRTLLLGLATRTPEEEADLVEVSAQLRILLTAPGDTLDELDTDARVEAYLRARMDPA